MIAFLRFVGWATLAFLVAWLVHPAYERWLGAVAGALAAPGAQVEWEEIQTYFPFDLSIYVALCLASSWATWRARGRALAFGLPALVGIEIVTLAAAVRMLIGAGHGQPPSDETQRLAIGLIRLTGLVAAGGAWLYGLGWQRVPGFSPGPRAGPRRTRRDR